MFTCALMMAASISGGELQACHRRNRHCNDCCEIVYDCNPCNGGTTTAPSKGGTVTPIPAPGGTGTKKATPPAGAIKISKDVSDLINSDAEIKEAYDGIADPVEKQKFVNDLQKTFDDAAKKAAADEKKPITPKKDAPKKVDEKKKTSSVSEPARILVQVPANATITFDGVQTRSTQTVRSFLTPELQTGRTYVYQLQSTLEHNGVTMVINRNIEVQAGSTSQVNVTFPQTEAPVSAQR